MSLRWIRTAFLWLAIAAYVFGMPPLLMWLSGDWRWMRGWIFYGALAALLAVCMVWMGLKDPALLAERLRLPGGGGEPRSDVAILFGIKLGFIALLVLPALDVRFGWMPHLPLWSAFCGGVLMAPGLFLFIRSFTDNTFLSQLVRIQTDRGHHLVSTGVYSFVRHPMYLGGSLMFVGGALVLGSVAGLLVAIGLVLLIVLRIFGEERVLVSGLEGYQAYRERVRYRLVPGVW